LWLARTANAMLLPSLLALHGAWLVRWIVFMGGQQIPKIGAASSPYVLSLSPDSLLGLFGTAGLGLFLYIVLTSFIPWDESAEA
jgi:tetrathionate reductase subunit C